MNNDVSFFVYHAREFRRVGSRQPQISFCMALARRIRLGHWRANESRRPARCTNFDRVTGNLSKRSRR